MDEDHPDGPSRAARLRRTALRILLIGVVALIVWFVLKDVPWADVGDVLTSVAPLDLILVLGLVLLRWVVVGWPMKVLIPELTMTQATRNELAAQVVTKVTPPPADLALRYAMFRSWRIDPTDGLAALTLSSLIFYVARFAAPIIGFVLLLLLRRYDEEYLKSSLPAALVAVAILVAIILIARAEGTAAWLGRTAGRIAARVRSVDPEAWETATVMFRRRIHERLRAGWPRAVLATSVLLVVEAAILVACLRAVGVSGETLALAEIAAAFLITYPLNSLPFDGIVVIDGALLEIFLRRGAGEVEAQVAAGLLLWRLATLIFPSMLGLGVLLDWRRREGQDFNWRRARPGTTEDPTAG
ncbi:lysylphosphatidylglycerol synthase domain-containing protein [Nocardioides sp. YIM 152588]|uniref:lysylphosphatidylglycerol synthase domain-containing protein n=1 Tax=Nocardioides sp. YIM 152588 TaxID=3158259 RepID=UPI0032E46A5A